MLFNTWQYIIFLPVVVIIYYLIPHKYRWILLLGASYYFYMCWKAEYLILILGSTAIDYWASLRMSRHRSKKKRKKYLILSLFTNLGILFLFKYFNFFSESFTAVLEQFDIFRETKTFNLLLPVGISFYTFQTLSYTIEVYMGKQKVERHLGIFATYVAFFPQLVAGPIERFYNLGPQFKTRQIFTYSNLTNGLRLILYGLFIKMVIADNISVYVDQVYANPLDYNRWSVITALFFYSFQIYSDFYGYSLVAIGSALLLGIKVMDNFKTPYMAKNIAEFWSRWHISLSTWFRDYVYIPMGGNRVKISRWGLNIMVVFMVSGLWHGANWTFVIWGAMYGVIYLIEHVTGKFLPIGTNKGISLVNIIRMLKNFFLVTIIWIFFRSPSIAEAGDIFSAIFNNGEVFDLFQVPGRIWIFLVFFILSDIVLYNTRFDKWCGERHLIIRWGVYFILIFSIIAFSGVENFPFIYFQF
jgi:D-alanyl-lipoteichoic acid acyltransferase DltB (MBOAT superfamily)